MKNGKVLVLTIMGVAIAVALVFVGIEASKMITAKPDQVYIAMGGGKENFVKDPDVAKIMKDKYNIEVVSDAWSNNKLVEQGVQLVREEGQPYDGIFFSDQRFYDYFKSHGLARSLDGSVILNTPVVIYSWDKVTDALTSQGVVEKRDNSYYIVDMEKLLTMIVDGTTWQDLGLKNVYGEVNVGSTDPVTSSPGATYYGLLASIMNKGPVTEESVVPLLPQLKSFYNVSGFMNNTPADLFDLYLRTGMGAKPMIVDYEKSMLDFAISNPEGYEQVKQKIRVLYPEPTIWNSHCLLVLTETGNRYLEALEDPDIRHIAWTKYGFRTGLVGTSDRVDAMPVEGIPSDIDSVVPGLKKEVYDEILSSLKK